MPAGAGLCFSKKKRTRLLALLPFITLSTATPLIRRSGLDALNSSRSSFDIVPPSPSYLPASSENSPITFSSVEISSSASGAQASLAETRIEFIPPFLSSSTAATSISQLPSIKAAVPTSSGTPLYFVPPSPSTIAQPTSLPTPLPGSSTGLPVEWLPPSPTTASGSEAATSTTSGSVPSETASPPPIVTWRTPTGMKNLDSFNITAFSSGEENLWLADEIPVLFHADSKNFSSNPEEGTISPFNRTSIEVWYPKGSIDPGNDDAPDGGSQFYAAPVTMSNATNVTFAYSVFFPVDFDWVLGGKLPGLYGGHTGCSGGNSATSCFSTRLMWRPKGAGELYLYAPKDSQGPEVCKAPPQSVCDAEWGLSVGRGSFYFAPGQWTHVSQTVVLNTPGEADGTFTLDVNGTRVIDVTGVYYRENPAGTNSNPSSSDADGDGGLLGGILGGILNSLFSEPSEDSTATNAVEEVLAEEEMIIVETPWQASPSVGTDAGDLVSDLLRDFDDAKTRPKSEAKPPAPPVGFAGVFFSTFFGGHTSEYATPSDQFTWFSDFSIEINR